MDPETRGRHHQRLTSGQDTRSARCGESRTPGAGGGPRETTGGDTGTAPAGLPHDRAAGGQGAACAAPGRRPGRCSARAARAWSGRNSPPGPPANEMTRGVARAAALAAAPAKKGRRAGQRVQAREISHGRTRRAVTAAIRAGQDQLHGADQGTREAPHRHRPEPAPRPQGQVRQHLSPRRPRGHRHPDRRRRHHPREHARLTSANTGSRPRTPARRPVEPAVTRHDTPATGMPATRQLPTVTITGNLAQTPKCLNPMALASD